MAIRNNHWYNLNAQRYYPLDDIASAISDQGQLLPSALIVDLRLRWPYDLGQYAFLSAISLTPHLITVLIEVTATLDNSTGSKLIAGVTLPRVSLTPGQTYAFQSFQPGVGGFIVIGNDELPSYSGRFSSPNQSLLTPRAAKANRRPPVLSLGIETAAVPLTGLVTLIADPPLALTRATRIINGIETDNVIVISLVQSVVYSLETQLESVFTQFSGPCGKRVGSRTCGDPQPIESVNGVTPDCDGLLTLDFRGCALVGSNVDDCGVVVDCSLGLAQSCKPPYLPTLETGELPNEIPPTLITPTPPPLPILGPVDSSLFSISESHNTMLSLPHCETFNEAIAHNFHPVGNSVWGFVANDSPGKEFCCRGLNDSSLVVPAEGSTPENTVPPLEVICSYGTVDAAAQSATNISLWTLDVQTLFRTYTTDIKIVKGIPGSLKNAGIVVNYRLVTETVASYLVALLDIDNSLFGLYLFNGLNLVSLGHVAVRDLQTDNWYRVSFTVNSNFTNVLLTATLNGVTDPTIAVTINSSLPTSLWVTDSGISGLYARRSKSYFSFWRVDEVIL